MRFFFPSYMPMVTSPLSGCKVLALYKAFNCASECLLERLYTAFFLRIDYGHWNSPRASWKKFSVHAFVTGPMKTNLHAVNEIAKLKKKLFY